MDPANPVVQLCVEGMVAEGKGRMEQAFAIFMCAWEKSSTDFERCIASHYVARHQTSAADALEWNQRALDYANLADEHEVADFYPSLYLNMGKAHENAGNAALARTFYSLAKAQAKDLGEGRYGDLVRDAIARGVERSG